MCIYTRICQPQLILNSTKIKWVYTARNMHTMECFAVKMKQISELIWKEHQGRGGKGCMAKSIWIWKYIWICILICTYFLMNKTFLEKYTRNLPVVTYKKKKIGSKGELIFPSTLLGFPIHSYVFKNILEFAELNIQCIVNPTTIKNTKQKNLPKLLNSNIYNI